jgi:D-alanyl-D-alanine carboxypeptidase
MKKNMKNLPIFILVFAGSFLHVRSFAQRTPADSMLTFINANKPRASVFIVKNDDPLAVLNATKAMPLAQVSNILIAIEFAQQATNGAFDENAFVPLSDVQVYYMPTIDSIAQTNWLQDENDLQNIRNDSISLLEVARGMAIYNVNANAEYLLDALGLDNVTNNIKLFGIKHHSTLYPLPASLFVYQNPKKESQKVAVRKVRNMSDRQFLKQIDNDHESLKTDTSFRTTFNQKDYTVKMQKLWNSKLPSCTVTDYINVCTALNNRKNFTSITYQILSEILESYMENPEMQKVLKHAGMISGSTQYLYNKLLYGTTLDNKRIEMAYFMNGLTPDESNNIKRWSDDFDYKMLTNNRFRLKVAYMLSDE